MSSEFEQSMLTAIAKLQKDVSHIKNMKAGFEEPKESKIKPAWGTCDQVKEMTGWNKEQMRRARVRKSVLFRQEGKAIEYDLNSIAPIFLLKNKN